MNCMGQGSNPGRNKRVFSPPKIPDWLWVTSSLMFNGYHGSFLGVKRSRREADTSIQRWGHEWVELNLCSLYTPSWLGRGQLYLRTYSSWTADSAECSNFNYMQHILSWEANSSPASQEISCILCNRRFITAFTNARHLTLSWAT